MFIVLDGQWAGGSHRVVWLQLVSADVAAPWRATKLSSQRISIV